MVITLIAAMVLRVINVTAGKMDLNRKSAATSRVTYHCAKSVGFTLPMLSQVKKKKCGMVKIKDITVAMHI